MIPATAMCVAEHTAPHVNKRIQHETQQRISAYGSGDRAATISYRLRELDREWDDWRTLQTNFAIFSMICLTLTRTVNKRWYAMAGGVPAFMVRTRCKDGALRLRRCAGSVFARRKRSTRSVSRSRRCAATSTRQRAHGLSMRFSAQCAIRAVPHSQRNTGRAGCPAPGRRLPASC